MLEPREHIEFAEERSDPARALGLQRFHRRLQLAHVIDLHFAHASVAFVMWRTVRIVAVSARLVVTTGLRTC